MDRKKLIVIMVASIIGAAMLGGSGTAFAHEGHDHQGAGVEAAAKGETELCPVSGEKADSKLSYAYKGKVYHFCCASCIADFRKDPEKYIQKMKEDAEKAKGHEHSRE